VAPEHARCIASCNGRDIGNPPLFLCSTTRLRVFIFSWFLGFSCVSGFLIFCAVFPAFWFPFAKRYFMLFSNLKFFKFEICSNLKVVQILIKNLFIFHNCCNSKFV
jgi:hypothetical protein